jgi:SET domain-containing protein
MALLEKQLFVKPSLIPGAGKGLFTKKPIVKGSRIVEYKGIRTTWKEVDDDNGKNGYIYYINRNLVIDAKPLTKTLGRYANDANGLKKIKALTNNARYVVDESKVYIEAATDIPAGGEILVRYGKEYWDIIRFNLKLGKKKKVT